jgi:hypothetical protein
MAHEGLLHVGLLPLLIPMTQLPSLPQCVVVERRRDRLRCPWCRETVVPSEAAEAACVGRTRSRQLRVTETGAVGTR